MSDPKDLDLAAALLEQAQAAIGIIEEPPGSNDGPKIREYLEAVGVKEPASWCAAAASAWLALAAAELGVDEPVASSASALQLAQHFVEADLWIPAHEAASCAAPGMMVFWRRPPSAWHGHVGVIEHVFGDGTFATIEGNSGPHGDRVARMIRRFDDPLLYGVGRLSA